MKPRRAFGWKDVLLVVIYQGVIVPCFRCKLAILAEDVKGKNVQREHIHERELDGPDEPENCRFSHTKCHGIITNGNGATSAGSSKNRIAKATHPKRIAKFVVTKPPIGGEGPREHDAAATRQSPRHRWPKPKLQSRGFSKTPRPMRPKRPAQVQEETR